MARPLRIEYAGSWHHVAARGNNRQPIFRGNHDRLHFLELLEEMTTRFRVVLHAYVLMGNHYHLLIELKEPNLSRAIQWLNVSYSVWFNLRHDQCGHLFQGRFKSVILDERSWAYSLSQYIHLNPVRISRLGLGKQDRQQTRTGMARKPTADQIRERIKRLRAFQWSSYPAYIGHAQPPKWLETRAVLRLGGGPKADETRNYRRYVENAVREGLETSPWDELKEQVVLGSHEFLLKVRAHVAGDGREQRGAERLQKDRPSLEAVIRWVEKEKGEKWAKLRDRYGDSARDLVLYLGRRHCGLTLQDLAAAVGMEHYSAVGMAVKRYAAKIAVRGPLRSECKRVEQKLGATAA